MSALSENREKPGYPKGVKPTPRPAPDRGKPVAQRRQKIQAIDLSHSRDQNGYAQHGPREYRKLHRLHTDVNKGVSAPIIRGRTPTFSYTTGSQPQISFLNHSVSTSIPNCKPSSDYDDGWMDDFPSPSVLLDNDKRNGIHPLACNFSSRAVEKAALDGDLASIHADHEDDDNPATILRDKKRKTIDLESSPYAIDQRETCTSPLPELPRVVLVQREDLQCNESDDRPFCSVNSPQQTTSPLEKQRLAADPEVLRLKETPAIERRSRTDSPQIFRNSSQNDGPRAKKRRVSDSSSDQVVLLSTDEASQSQSFLKRPTSSGGSSKDPQSRLLEESEPDFVTEERGFMGFI